jgi:Ca-activated chloride channel family protein
VLQLAHPWLLLLLPLPLLVRFLLPAHAERKAGLRSPFFAELVKLTGQRPSTGAVVLQRNLGQLLLLPLCWLLIVVALTQPQWVGEPIEKIESARDLMLVVDLSGSMDTQDFADEAGSRIDRLTAVKEVLRDFVAARETDRLSLIVFGEAAFLQVPFTLDHDLFLQLLDELQIGMAGPRTMMGDAIGLAIRAFEASEADERVAIVLTDGNDTGSKVPPLKAAELAAREGITLYAIGIGDPGAAGEAPLDEQTLRAISDATGGRYFRGENRAELESVYRLIDEQEPLEFETFTYRPTFELYHWPLGALVLSVLCYHLVMASWSMVAGRRRRSASD